MAPIIFSVDSHNLTVIESDGVEVEPVTFTGGIQIEVGQRYSVVLHADHEEHEQFWMRAVLVADQFKVPPSLNSYVVDNEPRLTFLTPSSMIIRKLSTRSWESWLMEREQKVFRT
jgi:hypothetical protein